MSDDNDDEMIEVLVRKMMNVIEIMIGKKNYGDGPDRNTMTMKAYQWQWRHINDKSKGWHTDDGVMKSGNDSDDPADDDIDHDDNECLFFLHKIIGNKDELTISPRKQTKMFRWKITYLFVVFCVLIFVLISFGWVHNLNTSSS